MNPLQSRLFQGAFLLLLGVLASPGLAETHIVRMMTHDPATSEKSMYFDPPLIQVQPGDTVIFEPTQMGHNSASKRGMLPDGAEAWNGPMDKPFEVTFTTEGTYGYICSPHYSVGMVGLVLVGDYSINLEAARKVKHRGKSKKSFRELFAEVDALSQ